MGDPEAVASLVREQEIGRLIEQLSALGVRLSAEGDELSVSAPRGALTSELRARLADQKAQLIARLRQPAARPASPWPVIVPATQERYLPFPLTDIQQAYWVGRTSGMTLGSVGCHGYWETDAVGIDIQRLECAWQCLIARHDMLRVIFLPTGEQQTLQEVPPFHIETVDLRERSAAAAAAELGALRERMSHRVYTPDQWPLFDIRAARLDERTTRLFLSIDLLVLDAASIFQLMDEARRFYEDPSLELPRIDLSFRDYVIAEARLRETDEYKRDERFWLERTANLPPAPDLPLANDPAASAHRFVRRLEQIEAPVWRELRARTSRAGLTPTGVLCAAWAEVLRVWSAAPEFTLTLTMFRRLPLHPQVNEIIGDFTSTILLECAPHSGGFEARARMLQARLAGDLDHSMVSGVHVMRERARKLGAVQDAGFPVVFTSTLGHQGAADREVSPFAWLGDHVYSVSQTPQVTLDLQVSNYADGALLVLDAVDALFPDGLLDELFDAYRRFVRRLAEDDMAWQESPRQNVPLPAAALETRARVNATAVPVSGQLLHELFFEQAAKHAPDTAVICPGRGVSYGELLTATKRIGRQLRNEQVRPNSIVAVVMEKGWEQVAAVLGVLASGAAYLPIEPTVPAKRLQYLLEHAQVRCVLTQPALDARLTWPEGVQRLSIDERAVDPGDAPVLDVVQRPTDLAYLIYTSGSTGQPKGVMIDHRGAVNTVLDINRRFDVGPADRVLALSSLGFDLSVYDIFGLLAAGGAIVFPEDARRHDPAHWSDLVDAEQITIWNTVPTLMEVWVEAREKEQLAPLPLRLVLMSGDWIPVTLPERIRALAARAQDRAAHPPRIVSLGGATEASIWSILYPIERVNPRWKSIPYGRAMANQTFHVLDEELEPRPVWVPGMLHIGGIGLAQGYWHDEEKTNASFIAHPRTGERLYRTGDLGRFLPDGNIEFLGRQDGQVKVGGHRIELGEIEANLLRHPAVQQTAVVVRQEPSGRKRLIGFIVPTPGTAAPDLHETLRQHLFSKLPDYMVPSTFFALPSMPVTGNAKIDRKKLVDLATERARPLGAAASSAPETTTERALDALVVEVLGQQTIGRFDSFFEAGCTSIELLRLASRVREVFGQNVALAELFRNPTIAALAARLDGREPPPRPEAVPAVGQPKPAAQHGSASPGQEQLWFAERLRPGRSTYHVHIALRMLGGVAVEALCAAITDVTRRHQALRMFFQEVDGRLFWNVRPAEEVDLLTVVRADGFEGEAREEEARRRAYAHARIPFDVDGGPLSRMELVTFAPDDALLLLTQHHLVTDGWSIGVLARDLMRAYLARAGGCAPDWIALPVEYGDLILREREWLEGDSAEQMRAWWRERLAGLRPLELPFRRRTADMPGDAGDSRTFRIGAALTSELQAFAAREGTTLFAALFAAFAALLHRYSRLDDFGVGIVAANRADDDQSDTIGFLANTVVLRCDVSDDPSFSTWLARATEGVTDTLERQRVPFFELARLAESRAHQGLNPLVEACFAFENVRVPEVELPGLACRPVMETPDAGVKGTAKFDLALIIAPVREGLAADFQFATELFDAPVIERMIGHFTSLLEAAVRSPHTRLSRLPLLTPAERRQVLVDWNACPATDPSDSSVAELVAAQAVRMPDAPALVHGDEVWSYATLNQRANRLARHLRTLGVGPEARVALCTHRCLEMVAGMLAVLKAGAAYVPIDPTYPAERQAFILEDSAASVVMGHQALLDALPVGTRPVVDLEQPCLEEDGAELPNVGVPESLAYVIYTSGSTGQPKGVENTQRGLMNLVRWYQRAFGVTPGDRATQTAALGFDATVFELWPHLTAGASVHIPSDAILEDFEALRDWLIDERITVSFLVTPLAEEMLGMPWPQKTTLRLLLTAADVLRRYPPENLPFTLVNNYGPTECAVCTTSGVVRPEANPVRLPAIGRPIDGVRAYVLDDYMEPVPPGCDGELYIGGVSVARGYRNAPALTAERFLPDPFGDEVGGRLYRTGDLVRWAETGELEFVGRLDTQVKVRGFRIELGEIEMRLAQHPRIEDSAVIAQGDGAHKRLVAFYRAVETTNEQAGQVPDDDLRRYLLQALPEYMVPTAFVALTAIPRTPNGKVDRRALPLVEVTPTSRRVYVAPRTGIEKRLADIWAQVLSLVPERIGINDDFFELGGHSLLAMQVMSRIRSQMDVDLPLKVLFERTSVAQLAELITQREKSEVPAIRPVDRRKLERLPLSFAQERLWFLNQLEPDSAAYNILDAVTIRGELDIGKMEQAFNLIIARHESLRTVFPSQDGQAQQLILDKLEFKLERIDLSHYPGKDTRDQKARELCRTEAATPFDLARGPLLRGKVIKVAEQEHILMLNMHHIISDGWSTGVLVKELGLILEALRQGRSPELPPLPIQYVDYSVWQRRWLEEDGVLKEQLAYWQEKLGGVAESLNLATDYPRPSVQSYAGATHNFDVDAQLTAKLKDLAETQGGTLYMVLLAAFKTLLYRYTGQNDICVGSPIANRQCEETEGLIGMFVNTLALRSQVRGEDTFVALLSQVKATCLEAYEHQDAPFEKVVDMLRPHRNMAISPIFHVMVIMQNAVMGTMAEHMQLYPLESGVSKFDLTITFMETPEGLAGTLEYSQALYKQQTIERMAGHFIALCRAITAVPTAEIHELDYVDQTEKHHLLKRFNDTQAEYPKDKCIHELLAEQAARYPEKTAVACGDETLTYQQLYEKSQDLALYLQSLGTRPDSLVAVCLERSVNMVVGLLGIMQAGGAYLPLDPEHPDERLAYMLRDSQAAIVLTQEKLQDKLTGLIAGDIQLVAMDRQWPEIKARIARLKAEKVQLRREVKPHHLVYVIYTSGSTGKPKGVQVTHQSVVNFICAMQKEPGITQHDTLLAVTTLSFDIAALELYLPLYVGAQLVIATRDIVSDGIRLLEKLQSCGATMLQATPVTWRILLEAGWKGTPKLTMLCGGEALPRDLADELLKTGCPLWNMYGPTETTIWSSTSRVRPGHSPVPLGHPISNTQIYVLDQHNRPQPVGVPGELHIAGDGLARGYLNRPELTQEKFLPNPFVAGARMYKTGDLARWLDDGNIQYLGRIDTQVKIRGFRIELGEIETQLNQHPEIRDSAVIIHDQEAGKQLIAFYRAKATTVDEIVQVPYDDLRRHLLQTLPEYMVPAAFVSLKAIPLNPSGKIDRRALARMEITLASGQRYVGPRNQTERQLVEIWAEVLKLAPEKIGIDDSFFELGGHSLLATQLISKIRSQLHVDLPLKALFERTSVAQLAELITQAGKSEVPEIRRVDRRKLERLPLSFAQERLWFLEQLRPGNSTYNLCSAVRLDGPLDARLLELSLNAVAERHDVLHTHFEVGESGEPEQVISQEFKIELPLFSVTGDTVEAKWLEVKRLAEAEATQPFDLGRRPLVRARLLQVSEQEHVALFTLHHIISDGWSQAILIEEIGKLYAAYAQGRQPRMEEMPIQYGDYAAWQREWLQGAALERQLQYWRKQLEGMSGVLELPTDRPRPALQSYRGAHYRIELDGDLSSRLQKLAREEKATLYMALLAAWSVLLWRYSGQKDIPVGTPIANRTREETEKLIGFFVNTLVVRTEIEPEESFRELLARVRETALGAYANQDVPFEKLVEELKPERDLSRSPLFQVMFALQNMPTMSLDLPGLEVRASEVESHTSKFDLTIFITEAESDKLMGWVEYSTDLFDEATIARMVRHWTVLLQAVVDAPQTAVAALPLMNVEESRQIVLEWNPVLAGYEPQIAGTNLVALFEQQVERSPEAVAVVLGDNQLNYRQLNDRANQLAHLLLHRGVGQEDLVGLVLPRSIEMVIALLAVLKTGAAYLPLDPGYPADRLQFMVEDAQPKVLLTMSSVAIPFPATAPRLALDSPETLSMLGSESSTNPSQTIFHQNTAYVIYTSGSTGKPKGVLVTHGNVARLFSATKQWFSFDASDVWTLFHSYAFDFSVWEIWGALLYGGRLVVVPYDISRSPAEFLRLLVKQKITVLNQTPSAFYQLMQADEENADLGQQLQLRYIVFGGEALELPKLKPWYGRHAEDRPLLINMYGITETTVHVTYKVLNKDSAAMKSSVIGRSIPDLRLYVLNERLEPLPAGVAGELYVAGTGLARGYLKRPELTAERFLPDAYGEAGSRMYRTGDLGRWLADGNFEFVGRNDFQVKIRGFRIELGEIEARLAEYPDVREAVVIAREDIPGDKRLVAYYTTSLSEESEQDAVFAGGLGAEQLRSHLSASLPEYMVPVAYIRLASLPLTLNGKLDRKALPAPETDAYSTRHYEPPQGEIETKLAAIWAEVLKLDRVGRHDNFFELGGHSLLAVQVISRIRATLTLDVPVRALFEAPEVSALAAWLEAVQPTGAAAPPITARTTAEASPLSFAQERLWFLDQLQPGSAFYNIPAALQLEGPLDVAVLERTLQEVVRRHAVLRTRFETVDGEPRQVIAAEVAVSLPVVDLAGLAEPMRETETRRHASAEARRPFDLATGPLLRTQVLRLGETQHVLLLTLHHIVADGWSIGILAREVATIYEALAVGRPSPWPVLAVQYADFAAWQREWLGRGALEGQLRYWQERLGGGVPVLDLPADRRRPATRSDRGAVVGLTVPRETTEALKALARAEGATLFMVLLAAFQTLLWRYTGQMDLVVGTPVAGRTRPEIEGLIGMFVNTLVLRTDMSGDPTFRVLLGRVKEVALGAYAHQEVPFEWLVERLQPERDPSRTPLFQTMLGLQNTPHEELQLRDVRLTPLEISPGTSKFDVTWQVREEARGLRGTLEYSTDLFDAVRMERMAGHLQTLLGGAAQPDTRLSELPVLTAVEQAQLIQWNETEAAYDAEYCLQELVAAHASRTPDAPALVCGDEVWSYGELIRRANGLARRLRMLGVGPGDRVGLTVERRPETMMALLGILQAGAAYVPLDMTYPPERLAWIGEDAGLRVIVTRQGESSGMPVMLVNPVSCRKEDEDAAGAVGRRACAHDVAYLIYTSGSTGKPKGVEIEHHSVVNLVTVLEQAIYRHHRGQGLRVGVNAPLTFDGSVKQVITLALGHALVLVPEEVRLDPEALLAYLEAQRVDVVDMTPAQLKTVLAVANGRPMVREAVLVGGEAIDEELWQQLAASGQPVFYNVYGPTECTVDTAIHRIGPDTRMGVVGGPVANVRAYVVGAGEALQPVGVPGELVVGGAGVGRGYMGRADLTAERFVPDPFGDEAGGRLYRTGDLVRWTETGELEFLGRLDTQVKVRGFRVELGEIEAVLSAQAAVMASVIVVREDTPGEKRLVAYVVAREGHTVSSAELRTYLKTQLPDYMIPAAFVFLETLPLTPHGKVNRAALPVPETIDTLQLGSLPRTPLEEVLASIWAEVLRRESVGIHDNFFDLGGHSLLAPRLFSMIEQRLGRRLPLGVLYRSPTIEAMAKAFSLAASQSSVLVPFAPVGDGPKFFCVHPAGGAVMIYKALADRLRPAVRLYGLQAPGVMDAEQPLRSIDAMARRYVDELCVEQPNGPYHIGGYSLGGLIAYEMANILVREGHEVATLLLIDCAPPEMMLSHELYPRLVSFFARVVGIPLREADVPELSYDETILYVARRVTRETVAYGTEEEIAAFLHRVLRLLIIMRQAWQCYKPRPYPGALIFLKAAEGLGKTDDRSNRDLVSGWKSLVEGPITVDDIPGTHETIILEPNVRELASVLSHYVLSADAMHARSEVEGRGLKLKVKGESV